MILRKTIRWVALTFALILLVGGSLGYLVMGSEPDAKDEGYILHQTIMANQTSIQDRIDEAEYDEDVDFATGAEIAEARLAYSSTIEDYGIGSIYIPNANIKVPLLAGTSEWNLFNGVGTGRPNQRLGQGLFVGLSHSLIRGTLLRNLNRLSPGDLIYITDFDNIYTYRTLLQDVVHETDSKYFEEPTSDESAKLLLYRCEGEIGTEWRQIGYAEFVDKKPMSQFDEDILEGLSIDQEVVESEVVEEDETSTVDLSKGDVVKRDAYKDEESQSKFVNTIDRWIQSFANQVSRINWLSDMTLRVYQVADNYPIWFGIAVLVFFLIYAIL